MTLLFQNTLGIASKDVPFNQTHNLTQQPEEATLIGVVWVIVLTMVLAAIGMAIVLFIRRTLLFKGLHKERQLRSRYETLLAECVAGEYEDEMLRVLSAEKENALSLSPTELQNPLNRRIFKEQLLLLHKNLSGHETNRLRDLYLILGFKSEAINVLKKKRNWQKQVACINELSQMGIREAMPLVFPLINHRNEMISIAALRTRVALDIEPLALLDDLTIELSDWQKTHLSFMLSRLSPHELPDFKRWFGHSNPSVATFARQMSVHFSDLDTMEMEDLALIK